MRSPVLKLTALAAVLGVGFLVVYQAQRAMTRPSQSVDAREAFKELAKKGDEASKDGTPDAAKPDALSPATDGTDVAKTNSGNPTFGGEPAQPGDPAAGGIDFGGEPKVAKSDATKTVPGADAAKNDIPDAKTNPLAAADAAKTADGKGDVGKSIDVAAKDATKPKPDEAFSPFAESETKTAGDSSPKLPANKTADVTGSNAPSADGSVRPAGFEASADNSVSPSPNAPNAPALPSEKTEQADKGTGEKAGGPQLFSPTPNATPLAAAPASPAPPAVLPGNADHKLQPVPQRKVQTAGVTDDPISLDKHIDAADAKSSPRSSDDESLELDDMKKGSHAHHKKNADVPDSLPHDKADPPLDDKGIDAKDAPALKPEPASNDAPPAKPAAGQSPNPAPPEDVFPSGNGQPRDAKPAKSADGHEPADSHDSKGPGFQQPVGNPALPVPSANPFGDDAKDAKPKKDSADAPKDARHAIEPPKSNAAEPATTPEADNPQEDLPTITPRNFKRHSSQPAETPAKEAQPRRRPSNAKSAPEIDAPELTPPKQPAKSPVEKEPIEIEKVPSSKPPAETLTIREIPPSALPKEIAKDGAPQELSPPPKARPVLPDGSDGISGDGIVQDNAPNGQQQPRLVLTKSAPPNAVSGQPLIYSILVRNVGDSPAHGVVVQDRIPRGTQLTGTIPQAELIERKLTWKLGTLEPGARQKISVRVVPTGEGVVGSITTVTFATEVAAKTVITSSKIAVHISAPPHAGVGQDVTFRFKLTNKGTGDAANVVLRDILPKGLKHAAGQELEYAVGTLPAGQSRDVDLTLSAAEAGEMVNRAVVTTGDGSSVQASAKITIEAPQLVLSRTGPKHRYAGREAVYTNTVTNRGNQPMRGITVFERIPQGMEFVEASEGGQFDASHGRVAWRIEGLPAGDSKDLHIKLLSREAGTMSSTIVAIDSKGTKVETTSETSVAGFATVSLDVPNVPNAIDVGETVSLRLVVGNRGTTRATNVALRMTIPDEMELVSVKGADKYQHEGNTLRFAPIGEVNAKSPATIEVALKARRSGDARVSLRVEADQLTKPLTREEAIVILANGQ